MVIPIIHDFSRSHWLGASDSKYIFATSQISKSWRDWFDLKCGKADSNFHGNINTRAGNWYEHSIVKAYMPDAMCDRQIKIPELRLRVNLDADRIVAKPKYVRVKGMPQYPKSVIIEVKTHRADKPSEVTDGYFKQAQLQMFALKRMGIKFDEYVMLFYPLYPDEYYAEPSAEDVEEGNLPIDAKRLCPITIKPARSYMRKIPKILRKLAERLEREEIK